MGTLIKHIYIQRYCIYYDVGDHHFYLCPFFPLCFSIFVCRKILNNMNVLGNTNIINITGKEMEISLLK